MISRVLLNANATVGRFDPVTRKDGIRTENKGVSDIALHDLTQRLCAKNVNSLWRQWPRGNPEILIV